MTPLVAASAARPSRSPRSSRSPPSPRSRPPATAEPSPEPGDHPRTRAEGRPHARRPRRRARATSTPAAPRSRTPAQRQAVAALGDVTARWGSLGTPASILPADGSLGAATGEPVAPRGAGCATTPPPSASRPPRSTASTWSARRSWPTPTPAPCSSARTSAACPRRSAAWSPSAWPAARSPTSPRRSPARPTRSPAATLHARSRAGCEAARERRLANGLRSPPPSPARCSDGWTRLTVPGFAQEQQVRLRALAAGRRHRSARSSRPTSSTSPGGVAVAYTRPGRRRHRHGPAPREQGREPRRRQRVHRRGHRGRAAAPSTPSSSPTTTPARSSRVGRRQSTRQRHRRQALRPGRHRARHGGPATSPEVADVLRRPRSRPAPTRSQVCPFDARRPLPPGNYAARGRARATPRRPAPAT